MRIEQHPDGRGITLLLDGDETYELKSIVLRHLPNWLKLFEQKNSKYAGLEGNELGAKGKFVDVFRKVRLLKSRLWDGHPVSGEDNEEVISDLIGHLFLMLHDTREEEANKT